MPVVLDVRFKMQNTFDTYLQIVPEFSDPDTFVTFTVSNGCCRTSLRIYADMDELSAVVHALRIPNIEGPYTPAMKDCTLDRENCMNIVFTVLPLPHLGRALRTLIVNDADTDQPYRAQIDILLNDEDAQDLANRLEVWIKNPTVQFVWAK